MIPSEIIMAVAQRMRELQGVDFGHIEHIPTDDLINDIAVSILMLKSRGSWL